MQPPVPHQPVRPPRRQPPLTDHDAAVHDVQGVGEESTDLPPEGFYGDLLPPEARPRTDWDWAPDNERRQR